MARQGKIKRLTPDDRMVMQACIHDRMNATEIASRLGVHKSTVSRELRNNSVAKPGARLPCPKRANGLCNGCPKTAYCNREKRYYDHREAERRSSERRSVPRSSPRIPESSIDLIDEAVSKGVSLGQSIHHIYASNPILATLASEQTVRRLCYRGCLSVMARQLRRYVRYRHPLRGEPRELRFRDIRVLVGRTYRDYEREVALHPTRNVVQYDSFMGKRNDRRALLTVTFPRHSFQFGILVDKGSPGSALKALRRLFRAVGRETVAKAFPINLADNGTEFSCFHGLEEAEDGERVCSTYFTDPYKATDKAECERLHELVRYFLPKGHSLDGLTQRMVDEMFSNINS